jgi:hypothetical protein
VLASVEAIGKMGTYQGSELAGELVEYWQIQFGADDDRGTYMDALSVVTPSIVRAAIRDAVALREISP